MRVRVAWAVVVLGALAYPLVMLADGGPPFPSREDCIRPALGAGEVQAVFGRFASEHDAVGLRDRALEVGFVGTTVERDACGRVKVVLGGIPSLDVGHDFAAQAREAGFEVALEEASQ